jgi:UDP-N-acetylmuramoyl-tripeptide--D-alanyl-D-alanine ligase
VSLLGRDADGTVHILDRGHELALRPSFGQAHQLTNLLAAVAAARALGLTPEGELSVRFSEMRGQRHRLPGGIVVIDDCYNANPMSMRAAIDDLAATAGGRTVAVLGDMLELGPSSPGLHREVGRHARLRGVSLLVAVGQRAGDLAAGFEGEARTAADATAAAELVPDLIQPDDTVLVKGSRGVGLERVVAALRDGEREGALAHGRPGRG